MKASHGECEVEEEKKKKKKKRETLRKIFALCNAIAILKSLHICLRVVVILP